MTFEQELTPEQEQQVIRDILVLGAIIVTAIFLWYENKKK